MSTKPKILIIEDEAPIAKTIEYALSTDGFEPIRRATGIEGVSYLEQDPDVALVILDVGLPDASGFEIFKTIRTLREELPILFLTARNEEVDKVVGLELGADDYITKPFSPRELSARVRNIVRRAQKQSTRPAQPAPPAESEAAPHSQPSRFPFVVNHTRMRISYHAQDLDLSRYEFKLLEALIRRPGHVLSREQLMNIVWDDPNASMERTVDAHIKQLRTKLRAVRDEEAIITHRGFGYSLREDW